MFSKKLRNKYKEFVILQAIGIVKGKRILHKAYLHCQRHHKPLTVKQTERPKKKPTKPFLKDLKSKKTCCPSTIKLTVNIPTKMTKNAKVRPHLLCMVDILHNHNHPIDCLHALTFRPMSEETKEAYYQWSLGGICLALLQN